MHEYRCIWSVYLILLAVGAQDDGSPAEPVVRVTMWMRSKSRDQWIPDCIRHPKAANSKIMNVFSGGTQSGLQSATCKYNCLIRGTQMALFVLRFNADLYAVKFGGHTVDDRLSRFSNAIKLELNKLNFTFGLLYVQYPTKSDSYGIGFDVLITRNSLPQKWDNGLFKKHSKIFKLQRRQMLKLMTKAIRSGLRTELFGKINLLYFYPRNNKVAAKFLLEIQADWLFALRFVYEVRLDFFVQNAKRYSIESFRFQNIVVTVWKGLWNPPLIQNETVQSDLIKISLDGFVLHTNERVAWSDFVRLRMHEYQSSVIKNQVNIARNFLYLLPFNRPSNMKKTYNHSGMAKAVVDFCADVKRSPWLIKRGVAKIRFANAIHRIQESNGLDAAGLQVKYRQYEPLNSNSCFDNRTRSSSE